MNIWLVTAAEPLPIDGIAPRLLRTGILAKYLLSAGHEVLRWASSFDHVTKSHRVSDTTRVEIEAGYSLWLLHSTGYQRNVSLKRVRDHRGLARQFRVLARRELRPDLILCSLPTVELALEASLYGREMNVPVVLDVRDVWPDALAFKAPESLRPGIDLLTSPLRRQAKRACELAFAICSHAEGFINWGLELAGRSRSALDRSFPFGYETKELPSDLLAEAETYWDQEGPPRESFVVCYAGSISYQFDGRPVLDAARILEGTSIHFMLSGTGPHLERYRRLAGSLRNISVTGWLSFPRLSALLRRSAVGLVATRPAPDFVMSIQNKVPEYLASGLPIASALARGALRELIDETDMGFAYEHSGVVLADRLLELADNPIELGRLAGNARNTFKQRFRADKVYPGMVEYLCYVREIFPRRGFSPDH